MQTFHTYTVHTSPGSISSSPAYGRWVAAVLAAQRIARGDDVRCEYKHAKRLILISVLIISDFVCWHVRVGARAHQPNISCEYKTVMTITITMLRAHWPHWTSELSVLCSGRARNSFCDSWMRRIHLAVDRGKRGIHALTDRCNGVWPGEWTGSCSADADSFHEENNLWNFRTALTYENDDGHTSFCLSFTLSSDGFSFSVFN